MKLDGWITQVSQEKTPVPSYLTNTYVFSSGSLIGDIRCCDIRTLISSFIRISEIKRTGFRAERLNSRR